jgi:hypothetical protein
MYPTPNNSTHQNKVDPNLPLPPPLQICEPAQQSSNLTTHDKIHTIIGGSNANFENKRQWIDYYRQVNHVVVDDPVIKTKWSHMPITFSVEDINLVAFPHTDAMVITIHIDRWHVTRILIDIGSQAEVLFLSAFDKMGYDRKQLKEPTEPLYGFSGKRIEPVSVITLPISFSTPRNPRTEYITTFEVALHSGYLCLKVSATFRIISVFGSQKDVRNIEQGFAPGHKSIHFVREELEQYQQSACSIST